MNVNIDNLEHIYTTLTGFESLSNGDLESPDSVYAKTVLKLNGVDFKHRAGTESFMSTVKAGAQKVYEMIKNFIKAIRDFFKGMFGKKVDQAVSNTIPETEKAIKNIELNLNKTDINDTTKREIEGTIESIKNTFNQIKVSGVDKVVAEKKIEKLASKGNGTQSYRFDEKEEWNGSVKVKINELLICDKTKFKEAIKYIDKIAEDYGMKHLGASSEFIDIRDHYEELKISNDKDTFEFVVDNLKTAKNVLFTLNKINVSAGDCIGVLNNLLEKINEQSRADQSKTDLTKTAIATDRLVIFNFIQSMTQLKAKYSKIALSINNKITKIQVLVTGEGQTEQSKRVNQEAMEALAHIPE
ncbi:hypothetical protein PQC65_gp026 [Aeromonas phage pAEv1810]|uniref:hypothetical protein n=1 Tax=Aeromonas phage pAEv1810 TaxID=2908744 RepID=UPI0023291A0E|nr:hypothetical protein PQC65_gp026 [Aeromonas phage pAEv1810]UIS24964.1 hypothetical protein pAEv1810_26 [Aeromonas phage pAEv1810]